MKYSIAVLAGGCLVQGTFATFFDWRQAPAFSCPALTNNKCVDQQKSGWTFNSLPNGPVNSYSSFSFDGFSCSSLKNKRDLLYKRTGIFSQKPISGSLSASSGPSFSCGSDDAFSIDQYDVTVDRDVDVLFDYTMGDGSSCTQVTPCSSSGTTVKNTQCGGAKKVSFKLPDHESGDCGINIHGVTFDCGSSEKPATSQAGPSASIPPARSSAVPVAPSSAALIQSSVAPASSLVVPPASSPAAPPASSAQAPPSDSSQASKSDSVQASTPAPASSFAASSATPPNSSSPNESSAAVQSSAVAPSSAPINSSAAAPSSAVVESSVAAPSSAAVDSSAAAPSSAVVESSAAAPSSAAVESSAAAPSSAVVESSAAAPSSAAVESSAAAPSSAVIESSAASPSSAVAQSSVVLESSAAVSQPASGAPSSAAVSQPISLVPSSAAVSQPVSLVQSSAAASQPVSLVQSFGAASSFTPSQVISSEVITSNVAILSSTSTPSASGKTANPVPVPSSSCPNLLPQCLNTWIFKTSCEDNTDSDCFCQDDTFIIETYGCLSAWGKDDDEVQAAVSYLVGICAKHIPTNPGIITNCPSSISIVAPTPLATPGPSAPPAGEAVPTRIITTSITTCSAGEKVTHNGTPTILATPSVSTVTITSTSTTLVCNAACSQQAAATPPPVTPPPAISLTTVSLVTTVTQPCTYSSGSSAGQAIPSSFTTQVIATTVTVPQVAFAPAATAGSSGIVLVPGPSATLGSAPTSYAASTLMSSTYSQGSATPSQVPQQFLGSGEKLSFSHFSFYVAIIVGLAAF